MFISHLVQERICTELTQKQKSSRDTDIRKVDQQLQQEEDKLLANLEKQQASAVRALKDRHAAEIAARPDLSDQQMKEVRVQKV